MFPDKKRTSLEHNDSRSSSRNHLPEAVSTSSRPPRRIYARPAMSSTNNHQYTPIRPPSPPATTYFSGFSNDPNAPGHHPLEPTAHSDAQAHFAYSTTLRRHHVDSTGHAATPIHPDFFADGFTNLINHAQRTWDEWRGGNREETMENGWRGGQRESEPPKEGTSGQFASWSIEVSR